MYFNIIASGSKGNATVVVSNKTRILIDMGISFIRLEEGLKEINLEVSDIDGAIFTHDHTDHISGLRFLSIKKCYSLEGTLPSLANVIEPYKPFYINEVKITPFNTSHDASNPCGYVIEDNNSKLVYMTDTGIVLEECYKVCENPDYLLIESNHDISMLMKSNRPEILKERIMSERGHLCNEDSAFATLRIIGQKTKEVILMHISEECNTPERAIAAYKEIFSIKDVDVGKLNLRVANQWKSLIGGHYEN